MSYTRHDFQPGQHLYAAQLNKMDAQIAENSTTISGITEQTGGTVIKSKNIFDPAFLTGAGWTYDAETDTLSGTPMQIRQNLNYDIPVPIDIYKPYIITCLAWTDGNQSASGNGMKLRFDYADGSRVEKVMPNATATPTRFLLGTSGVASLATKPISSLKITYESAGDNVWHMQNLMLVQDFSTDTSYVPEYEPYGYIVIGGETTAVDKVAREPKAYPDWMDGRYFNHINVSKYSNVNVPSQSIADVARSRRLGFNSMELNCHKTSDGHYITIHGNNGKFGQQVVLTDGDTSIQNVSISSVTLDYIKENVRYTSNYAQYRTSIPTLEEALYECRINGIHPYIQYVDSGVIEIADRILGRFGYALGTYDGGRPDGFDGVCVTWLKIADKEQLMQKIDSIGGLVYCGLDVTNSAFSGYSENDWRELTSMMHSKGYRCSFAAGYSNPPLTQKLFSCGFDLAASGWEIPDMESGNLYEVRQTPTFDGFSHAGTVTDGILYLPVTKNIGIPDSVTIPSVYLGGASLHVRFKGTLHIGLGRYIDHDFVSDGKHEIWVSSFYEGAAPRFYAKAIGDTCEIYEIEFKSCRM